MHKLIFPIKRLKKIYMQLNYVSWNIYHDIAYKRIKMNNSKMWHMN